MWQDVDRLMGSVLEFRPGNLCCEERRGLRVTTHSHSVSVSSGTSSDLLRSEDALQHTHTAT